MSLFDFYKKKTEDSVVVVELADFSKQDPAGAIVSRVEGGPGLLLKDGSVDLKNLMGIISHTKTYVPAAAVQKDFMVWCGIRGKKEDDPYATFYDLIRLKNVDLKSGRCGFDHVDFRKMENNHSGIVFNGPLITAAKLLKYTWLK